MYQGNNSVRFRTQLRVLMVALDGDYDVRQTIGAILLGTITCIFLSGIVTLQVVLYSRFYTDDPPKFKVLVGSIWLLDILHTAMIAATNWDIFITNWGNNAILDHISWTLATTISITALMTFIVQCFFAYRVYAVSRHNLIPATIIILAFLRLVAAAASTVEMIRLRSFDQFANDYEWIFTLGLTLSSVVDILITVTFCYFLSKSRTDYGRLRHMVDLLILYTIQSGMLTCIVTIATLICWVTMPHNLVFLGIHLCICKLYANACMATLNARRSLRRDVRRGMTFGALSGPMVFGNGEAHSSGSLPDNLNNSSEHDAEVAHFEHHIPAGTKIHSRALPRIPPPPSPSSPDDENSELHLLHHRRPPDIHTNSFHL